MHTLDDLNMHFLTASLLSANYTNSPPLLQPFMAGFGLPTPLLPPMDPAIHNPQAILTPPAPVPEEHPPSPGPPERYELIRPTSIPSSFLSENLEWSTMLENVFKTGKLQTILR